MISIAADDLWILTRCANKTNPSLMDQGGDWVILDISCSRDNDETLVYSEYIHRIILCPVSSST